MADPNDFSGKYNTPIPASRKVAFDNYVAARTKATGKSPLRDKYDYDVQGDWLHGAKRDERGHGGDTFKKPNHPTFSDQSEWNGIDGYVGGKWSNSDKLYQPSASNLEVNSMPDLQQYMDSSAEEGKVKLLPPVPAPAPTGPRGIYRVSDLAGAPAPPPAPSPVADAVEALGLNRYRKR